MEKVKNSIIRIIEFFTFCFAVFQLYGQEINTFISSDGVTLHYQIQGKGNPLFLISMGPGYEPNYLFEVADTLSKDFQIILLHQRGTGLSKMDSINIQNMNMDVYLKDIEDLRKHLHLDKISLLGNSFGGLITMSYAVKYPDQVKSFILVGSCGIDLDFLTYFRANIRSRLTIQEIEELNAWIDSLRTPQKARKANYEMIRITAPAYFYDKRYAKDYLKAITENSYNHLVSDFLWMDLINKNYDLKPSFHEFESPVLIIIGRQDIVGETTAYTIHSAIPNSKLMFIEDCGHFPWVEQKEIFYKAVREFLKFSK